MVQVNNNNKQADLDACLDPSLGGAPQHGDLPSKMPAPVNSRPAVTTSPTPYYHYSTSQDRTPQQSIGTGGSTNTPSQTSPIVGNEYQAITDQKGSPDYMVGGEGDPNNSDDPRRPRACEACRGLKVRCDQDPAKPDLPCKRCSKAGRQCIITQPNRKRQKKADSRVAELEKKLDALTAALHHRHASPNSTPLAEPSGQGRASISTATVEPAQSYKRRRTEENLESPYTVSTNLIEPKAYHSADEQRQNRGPAYDNSSGIPGPTLEGLVHRVNKLVTPNVAESIFRRYTNELCPHVPAVVIPPGTTASQVAEEKPILYISILSAGSFGLLPPDLSAQVAREAVGAIADCVVRNGEKSLELIQAMQVTALWYKPPDRAEQTNFYQIIHMAAVMALDIGLGRRFNPAKARRGFGGPLANFAPGPRHLLPQDSDTLEARRAWLTCYYLCTSASMVLRRPNLICWTNYMKECIEVLETHPDAYDSDKYFCQHVKIQHICEEIGMQFLMDDSTANISITDPKVTYALNVLENQLKTWKDNIPTQCRTNGLLFFEHVTSLYLHETALHFNHKVVDFPLPFTEESLKSVNPNTSDTLTHHQIAAFDACLKSAHGILDTMLSFEVHEVQRLPILLYFSRCIYASVILIKMHVAISTPNSELGKLMSLEDLQVDSYLERLVGLFTAVAKAYQDFRPHPKLLRILGLLHNWYLQHKESLKTQRQGEPTHSQQTTSQMKNPMNQTPLHLLSQVATDDKDIEKHPHAQDWTFSAPFAIDYSLRNHGLTASREQTEAGLSQAQQASYPVPVPSYDIQNSVDPNSQGFGWGTGFEQAMDIAFGGMDGLQAPGLDNWLMGEGMAPFGMNGDNPAPGAVWQ